MQIVSRGHTRPLTEINFFEDTCDRTLLISSAHDKIPQIRNGETGDWIGTFHGHKGAVWSAKLDYMTRTLAATASGDFSSKLWCATTGKELYEFKHKHVVKTVDFSNDTQNIATGCQDGLMRIFDIMNPSSAPSQFVISPKSSESPTKISFLPNNSSLIIVGTKNSLIQLWDRRISPSSACVATVSQDSNGFSVMDIEINRQSDKILVTIGRKVLLLAAGDLSLIQEFSMPDPLSFREEGGASMHPDGTRFVSGGSDLWLREFEVSSGKLLRTFKGHHGPVRCVRYHPSGDVVASGSEDGTIRLWDLKTSSPEEGSSIV